MAVIAKARSLSTSGSTRPIQLLSRQRGAQPVAALASARRSYWASHSSKSKDSGAYSEYGYMRNYPGRVLPRYSKQRDGPQCSYIDGLYRGRLQTARSSSNWAREDKHNDENRTKDPLHPGESQWEVQRRRVRERMQRRLEAHMSMLRKDPYWGLFGSSEERGVWNPWNRARETLQYLKNETWEETSKRDEYVQGSSKSTSPPKETSTWESDYTYDPISNKRVRRPDPAPAEATSPAPITDASTTSEDASQAPSVRIPVRKYRASGISPGPSKQGPQATSSYTEAELSGFARQPWLLNEGFLNPDDYRHAKASDASAFAKSRKNEDDFKRNVAEKERAAQEASFKEPSKLQDVPKTILATSAESPESAPVYRSSGPTKLTTSLYRSLQSGSKLRYDESLDRREGLDKLRPDAIRAAVPKPVVNITPQDPQQRRSALEKVAASMFEAREERLDKEFAANKWNLKRTLSAYPGDFPRTLEELRARRHILERSLATSADVVELHLSRALDPTKPASPIESKDTTPAKEIKEKPELANTLEAKPRELVKILETRSKTREDKPLERSDNQKEQQRELIREIRNIYESTYGVIDTKHRQPSLVKAAPAATIETNAPKAASSRALTGNRQTQSSLSKEPQVQQSTQARKENLDDNCVYASSGTGTKIQKPRNMLPQVKPDSRSYYPFENSRELDASSQLLEASVRDFEQLMATSNKTVVDTGKESTPLSTTVSDAKIPAIDTEILRPVSQHATDRLVAELADIAAEAPRANEPKESTATTPQSYVLLSYSKSSGKLKATKTTSSIPEKGAGNRTIHSILSRLDKPEHYFEHMSKLEQAGYELVAGGRKMLIYKDVKGQSPELPFDTDEAQESKPERGWGTPEEELTKPKVTPATSVNTASETVGNSLRRSVRRVEETFSGSPPRYESERIAEEITKSQKRRDGPVWRLFKGSLLLGTLFYSFGVTLEWLKDNEKRKLIDQYQKEVKRVQELERKKAQEQSKGFGWGF